MILLMTDSKTGVVEKVETSDDLGARLMSDPEKASTLLGLRGRTLTAEPTREEALLAEIEALKTRLAALEARIGSR